MAKKHSMRVRTCAPALALLALMVSGCRAVEVIFKAGAWTATIGILLLALLVFGVSRLFRRGG